MCRRALSALALCIALGGVSTACGGAASDPDDANSDPSGTPPSATTTSAAVPTELAFGEAETVAWEPASDLSGELSIQIDGVRAGSFAEFEGLAAPGISEDNQPYYVDVVITNEGDAELGGLDVPLYLVDSGQTLSPPSKFADPFEPCQSGPLPSSFGAGDTAEMCLVFFSSAGATFESITFQPTSDAAAIAWRGDVTRPAPRPD